MQVDQAERGILLESLNHARWNRGKTADLLGTTRRTLQRKMVKHGLRESR